MTKVGKEKLEEEYIYHLEEGPLSDIGGSAGPIDEDLFHWAASFIGPTGSFYENGLFIVEMKFTNNYPNEAPRVRMRTQTYHPNIKDDGNVCVDYLTSWKNKNNITGIINAIFSLLSLTKEPEGGWHGYANRPFDPEKAKEWRRKYAFQSQTYNWNESW